MQAVDDAFFLEEYFRIVVENPSAALLGESRSFSQDLPASLLQKAMEGSPERQARFSGVFGPYAVSYALRWLEHQFPSAEDPAEFLADRAAHGASFAKEVLAISHHRPFYLQALPEPEALFQELLQWDDVQRSAFLAWPDPLPRKPLTRRAFEILDALSPKEQTLFWTALTRDSSPAPDPLFLAEP